MAYSRLCAQCDARWPQGWAHCPVCRAATKLVSRDANRSKFQALEADFERRYAERERQRIADGLLAPEGIGKREAEEIIRLERSLGEAA